MSQIPKPHEIYKHFKGNLYQVLAVAEHSETGEQLVIYQALYGEFKIYARPLESFLSPVDKQKYPEVTQEYRFELQGAEPVWPKAVAVEKPLASQEVKPVTQTVETASEEELQIHPMVLRFLDADTYEERLDILVGLRAQITDEMITTMAIACDVEVPEGSLEERYDGLKTCLLTLEKYECNRLR